MGIPRPPITGRHSKKGWGLRVLFSDALGDGFEAHDHGPHAVILAAGEDDGAVDVAVLPGRTLAD